MQGSRGIAALPIVLTLAYGAIQEAYGDEATPNEEVQEVVVTAQFRSQRLQDTPIAISAFSGSQLSERSLTDVTGASSLAPNVSLTPNSQGFGQIASIFIRGVGQADPHFAVEPGVGMYVDDVYFGVLPGSVFQLLDTDRIEVLRGPQGTLAGKNSLGGSIKVFSKRPGPEPDAYAEVSYGSFNAITGRAATNVTLIDGALYARFSVAAQHRDGYLDRLDYSCAMGQSSGQTQRLTTDCRIGTQGGVSSFTARAVLAWTPLDSLKNTLIADVDRDNSENPATKTIYAPTTSIFGTPTWATGANYITCGTCYTNFENNLPNPKEPGATGPVSFPNDSPLSAWGVTDDLQLSLAEHLRLEVISAYRRSDVHFFNQIDGTPASVNDQSWELDHSQYTEELRVSGEVSHFAEWTLGAFFYHAAGTSGGRIIIPFGLQPGGGGGGILQPADILFRDPVTTMSKSVFAHLALHPVEKLTLTFGGRYTKDSKEFKFMRYDPLTGLPNPAYLYDVKVKYAGSRPDYRFDVDYEWNNNLMTYAQVATGYRGGGVNPRPYFPSQALPYQPEVITAYEFGFKSQLFDRHLTANFAGFYNVYHAFQAALLQCDSISPFPGAPCNQTTNVGDAHVKGLEYESSINGFGGLGMDLSLGLLKFEYTHIDPNSGIRPGMTNVFTPKVTGSIGAKYEFAVGSWGWFIPRFDFTYRSKVETLFVNDSISELAPLGLLNARLAWQDQKKTWEAAFSINNLTDKFYYQSKQVLDSPVYNVGSGTPGLPRTYVFTVRRSL